MSQAPAFDCLAFHLLPFEQNGLASSEVDIGGGEVAQALVVALVVVVGDEGVDLGFEGAGQAVVLQQYPVLQRLVPAFDLALGLGMVQRWSWFLDHVGGKIEWIAGFFMPPVSRLSNSSHRPRSGSIRCGSNEAGHRCGN